MVNALRAVNLTIGAFTRDKVALNQAKPINRYFAAFNQLRKQRFINREAVTKT